MEENDWKAVILDCFNKVNANRQPTLLTRPRRNSLPLSVNSINTDISDIHVSSKAIEEKGILEWIKENFPELFEEGSGFDSDTIPSDLFRRILIENLLKSVKKYNWKQYLKSLKLFTCFDNLPSREEYAKLEKEIYEYFDSVYCGMIKLKIKSYSVNNFTINLENESFRDIFIRDFQDRILFDIGSSNLLYQSVASIDYESGIGQLYFPLNNLSKFEKGNISRQVDGQIFNIPFQVNFDVNFTWNSDKYYRSYDFELAWKLLLDKIYPNVDIFEDEILQEFINGLMTVGDLPLNQICFIYFEFLIKKLVNLGDTINFLMLRLVIQIAEQSAVDPIYRTDPEWGKLFIKLKKYISDILKRFHDCILPESEFIINVKILTVLYLILPKQKRSLNQQLAYCLESSSEHLFERILAAHEFNFNSDHKLDYYCCIIEHLYPFMYRDKLIYQNELVAKEFSRPEIIAESTLGKMWKLLIAVISDQLSKPNYFGQVLRLYGHLLHLERQFGSVTISSGPLIKFPRNEWFKPYIMAALSEIEKAYLISLPQALFDRKFTSQKMSDKRKTLHSPKIDQLFSVMKSGKLELENLDWSDFEAKAEFNVFYVKLLEDGSKKAIDSVKNNFVARLQQINTKWSALFKWKSSIQESLPELLTWMNNLEVCVTYLAKLTRNTNRNYLDEFLGIFPALFIHDVFKNEIIRFCEKIILAKDTSSSSSSSRLSGFFKKKSTDSLENPDNVQEFIDYLVNNLSFLNDNLYSTIYHRCSTRLFDLILEICCAICGSEQQSSPVHRSNCKSIFTAITKLYKDLSLEPVTNDFYVKIMASITSESLVISSKRHSQQNSVVSLTMPFEEVDIEQNEKK